MNAKQPIEATSELNVGGWGGVSGMGKAGHVHGLLGYSPQKEKPLRQDLAFSFRIVFYPVFGRVLSHIQFSTSGNILDCSLHRYLGAGVFQDTV